MRSDTQHRWRLLWSSGGLCLLTMALWVADGSQLVTSARMTAHNLLSPGRMVVAAMSAPVSSAPAVESAEKKVDVAALQNALLQNELQRRQLLIQNARLANELRTTQQTVSVQSVNGDQLLHFRALRARVLSHAGLSNSLSQMIVDAGASSGLRRMELVVDSSGLVIDQGRSTEVENGQKVAAGMTVIGRIIQTAQWISRVQLVTDKEFSAAIQLVRMAPHGALFGAEGLLEGTGEGTCRITGIPYTEAVSVGDEVFSAELNGINGPRLYYGKVVQAQFSSGGQWTITVEPGTDSANLTEVSVIQPLLNDRRVQFSQRPSE
ncbi:MAG: rod shape-determining protein MreC [Planctomycetaceae bacterium]|nr:rod shape-determining protein MreC [Planctomycetaceae bacterium]